MQYPRDIKITHRTAVRRIASAGLLVLMLASSDCGSGSSVVWSGLANAPSGGWVASVETIQNSGPGAASVIMTVSMHHDNDRSDPVSVLVLENPSAANIEALRVDLSWPDAKHLDIVYPSGEKLDFRADLYGAC
jgi:hypothetical protein